MGMLSLTSEQAHGLTEALETVRDGLEPGEGVMVWERFPSGLIVEGTVKKGGVNVDEKGKCKSF